MEGVNLYVNMVNMRTNMVNMRSVVVCELGQYYIGLHIHVKSDQINQIKSNTVSVKVSHWLSYLVNEHVTKSGLLED